MNIIDLLSKRLPLSRSELLLLIATAPNRYKVHSIEKRHGRGKRTIAQPTAEVKMIQRLTQGLLRDRLPVHECAKAYQPGTSIKDHAAPHAANSYLLKVDFKNFFPSIVGEDFIAHLTKYADMERQAAEVFVRVFFWRPKKTDSLILAIGAPSSPWLSNSILYDFDSSLSEYCHANGIVYTRYADDLALSTNVPRILSSALEHIRHLLDTSTYPRVSINEEKTVFTSKKFNRTLAGLVLSNEGTVSVGRDRKREIRALAHGYSKGIVTLDQVAYLRGILAFTMSIDTKFNESIARMLGKEKYSELMK